MKQLILAVVAAAVLTACGSSVKLDTVPVEDKSGAPISGSNSGETLALGDGNSTKNGGVNPVELSQAGKDDAMRASSRTVYFDYDSSALLPEFQSVIEAHARFIKADRSRKVSIEGHTDERGGREYNLALGQKRAEVVRRAMVLLGVLDEQLEAVSFGKEKPAMTGGSEAAMDKNRRAEISYR
jgi:peptidoglycan-associated lipoprotein